MSLEENLKELRKQHNLSQQEFADMLHVSRQAVSRWETGRAEPDVAMLKQISQIYQISVDDLLNDNKKQEKEKTEEAKSSVLADEVRYSEYMDYLESLNASIMLLASLVTIVIPFIGIAADIVIITQLGRLRKKKRKLLFTAITVCALCAAAYYTYRAVV